MIDYILKLSTLWSALMTTIIAFSAAYQLPRLAKQINMQNENSKWARENSTQQVVREFFGPHLQEHWKNVQEQVIINRYEYEHLRPPEQESLKILLNYLEVISSLILKNIVEREIVLDTIGGVWQIYFSSQSYIEQYRKDRQNDKVYENLEKVAQEYFAQPTVMA